MEAGLRAGLDTRTPHPRSTTSFPQSSHMLPTPSRPDRSTTSFPLFSLTADQEGGQADRRHLPQGRLQEGGREGHHHRGDGEVQGQVSGCEVERERRNDGGGGERQNHWNLSLSPSLLPPSLPPSCRLVDDGFNPSYGARPLRRAIMRLIEDCLSERILTGEIKEGDVVIMDIGESASSRFALRFLLFLSQAHSSSFPLLSPQPCAVASLSTLLAYMLHQTPTEPLRSSPATRRCARSWTLPRPALPKHPKKAAGSTPPVHSPGIPGELWTCPCTFHASFLGRSHARTHPLHFT